MAQFARPSADVARGSWVTGAGGTVNLWATLDEEAADDADLIASSTGVNDAYETRLSVVAAPTLNRLHVLRYRGKKSQTLGNTRGVTVELRQGATVIATNTHPDLTAVFLDGTILLTRAQAAAITDYADLRVRFTATGATGGSGSARRAAQISWCQLRVPEDADLIDDLITRWGVVLDESVPGVVTATLAGVTGTGPRRVDALVDLRTQLRDLQPQDATNDRRWHLAYYLAKRINYLDLRLRLAAGTASPPGGQTQAEALAICDAKLAGFVAIVRQADAGEAD